LSVALGGGLLAVIILYYQWAGDSFGGTSGPSVFLVSLLMNMFYARLFVPSSTSKYPPGGFA
jgi:STE24 endopeptidase